MDMKILFVTGIYPRESEEQLRKFSGNRLQNAANAFQWSVIDGLVETECDFEVVSLPFLPSYPMRYKRFFTPSADITYQGERIGSMLSYCSLVGVKYLSIKQRLCAYIGNWIKRNESNDSQLVVLIYNLHPAYVEAVTSAIRGNKRVKIASIVTDLVDHMSNFASNRSPLKGLQCRIESYKTKRLYKNIDKYILLTQAMETKIEESVGRNIVVEGLVKPTPLTICDRSREEVMFLYTGALDEFTGVKDMVDAFMLTKSPRYRLVICGVGALKDYIVSKSRIDERIEFRGVLPREECISLQHKTTCLINPRKPNGDITKYSFPSKTMEYMMSGTPMIGYRLEGIPSDYYEYMYTPDDMSNEALARMIEQVAMTEQGELDSMAVRAYEFISTHKTAQAQVRKMLDFLSDNLESEFMPTIVQINSTINVGSTGRIAEQIGAKAIARGWTSCAVYGRACGDSRSMVISIGSIVGVWLHAILTRITDRHGLFSRIATKRLVRKIEEISPDIVHLHNIHGYYVNYKMLFDYLCKSDIKIVWTLHDCWPITGHCAHFECAQCDRWKSGCYGCPEKHSYPRSIGIDRSRKNYIEKRDAFTSVNNMTIVPVSIWLGNILKESFLKQYDIEVIHNGIDIGTFRPVDDRGLREKYGIAGKKVILGVASPWSERKGLEDFKKMSAILPDNRYQLVMIGLQGRQLKMLPEGVIGLSRTSNVEELAAWYSLADVFVNPTYEDTYPTTNLEAISCGTPVVTYRTGGAPESLTSNTGRVVSRGDVKGLVEAIESICSEDREIMREHCREYAEMHFDKNKCFEKYMSLYENLINK